MKKVLLIILDGWGIRRERKGNAVKLAKTPNFDYFWKNFPHTTLKASGEAVGLPKNTLGGSEVGHLHIGAGRIVKQKLTQINESIENGVFEGKMKKYFSKCAKGKTLHVMGLLSDAGVHSDIKHLFFFLKKAEKMGIKDVKIHCFLDGRDTPPKSASKYLNLLKKRINGTVGSIATVSGRYYSMDRDLRWHRTGRAYDAIVKAKGKKYEDPIKALKGSYKEGKNDEFVKPVVMKGYEGLKKDDFVFSFNFRPDRMRQIIKMLLKKTKNIVTMTQYSKSLRTKVLFEPDFVKNSLGETVSKKGLRQLRISESEKGPHVTYFFSGQREKPFRKERRIIIPSPKVPTYDFKPEMSAYGVTEALLKEIKKDYGFILLNFANGDMVGHTGVIKAAKKAAEVVDFCLGRIVEVAKEYTVIITADHGNFEDMRKGTDFNTAHTLNKVPFVIVDGELKGKKLKEKCGLSNIAPTVLKLMKIKKPKIMTNSLF